MTPVIRTPDLQRALADYTGRLGFTCRQHIPGVLALLDHGPLALQLWASAPSRGAGKSPIRANLPLRPNTTASPFTTSTRCTPACAARPRPGGGRTDAALNSPGPGCSLGAPGSSVFSDIDGHVVHCVDWGVHTRNLMDQMLDADGHEDDP